MKRIALVCLLVVTCMLLGSQVRAADLTGNLNFLVGQKLMNGDWKEEGGPDLSKQLELGLMFDIRMKSWPVNIALDYLSSSKSDSYPDGGGDLDGSTSEIALGVRKYFMEDKQVKPYVGGGVASISGKIKDDIDSISDSAIGPWVNFGVKYNLLPQLNIGLDGRYSHAKSKETIEGEENKWLSGGWHWGLFVGWAFGTAE